jgi:hypothetical protein
MKAKPSPMPDTWLAPSATALKVNTMGDILTTNQVFVAQSARPGILPRVANDSNSLIGVELCKNRVGRFPATPVAPVTMQ